MKDEIGRKITTEFVALKPKTCRYLTRDSNENSKAKNTNFCSIKSKI